MSKHNVVVISNGMVGHRFIEELIDKADPGQFALTVFCEEPRVAYDRVHLSAYFSHHTAEELSLVREGYYEKHQVELLLGERAITINREEKLIHSNTGRAVRYDTLIFATGSYPWIPPIKGSEGTDCFVYRTIEDLNAIEACARRSKRGAVIGGGLLGLEATGALKNLGIETHVIEFAPELMAEQLDVQGGEQLRRKMKRWACRCTPAKIPSKSCTMQKAVKPCSSPTAARLTSTLSCSLRVFARKTNWRNSAAWRLASAVVSP